ncbi:MAG: Uncharacterised protein [SAR116 cluster bacterium]|nr:MAG: Uncharacterised protein [SAR116 cluster bacterium]
MAANYNRLCPAWYQPRHVAADDGLTEYSPTKNVADGAVGRAVHALQPEFLYTLFIRCDGGAFDTHAIFLDGICGIDGDLVIRLVAFFDAEIIIFQINIEIGEDQLVLDLFPDNAGHLVAVNFDNGGLYFNTGHRLSFTKRVYAQRHGSRYLTCSRALHYAGPQECQTWRCRAGPRIGKVAPARSRQVVAFVRSMRAMRKGKDAK